MLNHRASAFHDIWARLLIEELVRHDIKCFCVGPGSRSTPLTMAIAEHQNIQSKVVIDERALGFYALGHAKSSGVPSVIITTSGTAVANLMPAVVEAYLSHAPLIVLTADRPPELLEVGANQTILQTYFFGKHVKYAHSLGVPDESVPPQALLSTIDYMVKISLQGPPGPVHLNCPFRGPFHNHQSNDFADYLSSIKPWVMGQFAYREDMLSMQDWTHSSITEASSILKESQRGIVVVGYLGTLAEAQAVTRLAEQLEWPIYLDIQSMIPENKKLQNLSFGQLEIINLNSQADVILHIGGRFTEKLPVWTGLHVQILPYLEREDPYHTVRKRWVGPIVNWCKAIGLNIKGVKKHILSQNQVKETHVKHLSFERQIVTHVLLAMPEDYSLFLGNSLSVRWANKVGLRQACLVGSNRGASGIDGLLATALGFSSGKAVPVILIIGDLSCLYDLNSLVMLKSTEHPIIVVILNNNGGQLFSQLPIAKNNPYLDSFFIAPQNILFSKIADSLGVKSYEATTLMAFKSLFSNAVNLNKSVVIDVLCPTFELGI